MTTRILGTSVMIKPALPETALLLSEMDPSAMIRAMQPTESEIRDAAQKLAAELREIVTARTAGQAGWEVIDAPDPTPKHLGNGEWALFGIVLIRRKD